MAGNDDLFEGGPVGGRGSGGSNVGGSGEPGNAIDPASVAGGTDDTSTTDDYVRNADGSIKRNRDGTPRKKRGRKPGSAGGGNASARSSRPHDLKQSIDALTNMIGVVHHGIAVVANAPEMVLSDDEARLLAKASIPVLEQFDFQPDPRFTAVFGLLVAAGQVYVPRAMVIRMRRADERSRRAKPVYDSSVPLSPDVASFMAGTAAGSGQAN